jgi:polyribonucleotide nucleotidyltransferase
MFTMQINPDKIRDVIGSGGKTINKIIDETGVKIDIDETGKIFIACIEEENAKRAMKIIDGITGNLEVGEVFEGKVTRIMACGAFVEFLPGQEGLVHISKLAKFRVEKVEDVVREGDIVKVKFIGYDKMGRLDLSIKDV